MQYSNSDYIKIVNYLPHNSSLKMYSESNYTIEITPESFKHELVSQNNKTVYFLNSVIEQEKVLCSGEIQDVIKWLKSINTTMQNKETLLTEYNQSETDYAWNEIDILKELQKKNESKCNYIISINDIQVCEYEETLVFPTANVEYRHYKTLFIELNFLNKVIKIPHVGKLFFTGSSMEKSVNDQLELLLDNYEKWDGIPYLEEATLKSLFENNITCIATPSISNTLIHEAIGHFTEADVFNQVANNKNLLSQKIASYPINVIDCAHPKDIPTKFIFDDKGTRCQDIQIMHNGFLVGILSDKFEQESNFYKISGVQRGAIQEISPQIRMRNTILMPGNENVEEWITNFSEGLILLDCEDSHTSIEGSFCLVNIRAYYVKNGCIIGKIENFNLGNDRTSFLQSIMGIGTDSEWSVLRRCEKNNAKIYLSCLAPSMLCKLKMLDS